MKLVLKPTKEEKMPSLLSTGLGRDPEVLFLSGYAVKQMF